ncbi:hypothetical protein HKD37_20G056425 [Glycine soja]
MENVFVVMYYDGDILSSSEGVLFECLIVPKFITISKYMSLDALRKTVMKVRRTLLDLFYSQPIYVDDDCVEYECMELKCDDDVDEIFFIFSEFSSKGPIELNATFDRSPDEILVLLHKQ